jgi:ribosomal protein L37AE/L43A
VATKKAKTAIKGGIAEKPQCPNCASEIRIVRYAGFGPKGLFWVCDDKKCGYKRRTR